MQKESSPLINKGIMLAAMRNDIDLIREILSQVRDCDHLDGFEVQVAGHDPLIVARHVERLVDDGYIDTSATWMGNSGVSTIYAKDLSSKGHAFLASLEAEDVWQKIKLSLSPTEIGRLSLRQLGSLAGELAEKALRKKLGLD